MSPASRSEARPDWRPRAPLAALRARAELLERVRAFFAARGVLEVETPVLGAAPALDPHVRSLTSDPGAGERRLYLQASPEHAMKRLLARGTGSIYQIGRAFRAGEAGRYHNPEFTLLEWYRVGFDHHALMDEVEALLRATYPRVPARPALRLSYREAFARWAGVDPFRAELAALHAQAAACGLHRAEALDRDACLDVLLERRIQPGLRGLAVDTVVFVHDFPASQAAMARIRRPPAGEPPTAERFELFIEGVEIANGYHELTDAAEQRRRFEAALARCVARGEPAPPIDERLLAALEHGLPACAGVALGLDRLLMLATGAERIEDVLTFPVAAL